MKKLYFLTLALLAASNLSYAQDQDDGAYLDPPYTDLVKVTESDVRDASLSSLAQESLKKVRFQDAVRLHTPVRSQGSRGTCSIFSATSTLENALVQAGYFDTDLDLSEEWLEYLIMRNRSSGGSDSSWNFSAYSNHGFVTEELMPYIGETWKSVSHSSLSQKRCGHLSGSRLTSCLLGHRDPALLYSDEATLAKLDPEFLRARTNASENLEDYLGDKVDSNNSVYGVAGVKALLDRGIPVVLGLEFYYGAWNHRVALDLGIGRNMDHWSKGIVGYPEKGSVDRRKSKDDPAGHSIVVVGYDDDVEVEVPMKMDNGSTKIFTYRGVYYFKNSWGAQSFGVDFELDGQKYPGYGVMTQKYAHDFGGFYIFTLKSK